MSEIRPSGDSPESFHAAPLPNAKNELEDKSGAHLTAEELDFIRSSVNSTVPNKHYSIAEKSIAEANWIFDHPELGTEEVKTSAFLERKLGLVLGSENVGRLGGGVYGILDGDDSSGMTLFIRGDMDALVMPPGSDKKNGHMCGHHIHSSWTIENARVLKAYKERFGTLPFKRVVFIGEPNEEGAKQPDVFGAKEMINAGLIEKTGKPDFVLAAHYYANQSEGTIRIDHEAALASDGRFLYTLTPSEEGQDLQSALYEIVYQVGQEWQSENQTAHPEWGERKIVKNAEEAVPDLIVRVSDTKYSNDERRLRANTLAVKEEVHLVMKDDITDNELQIAVAALQERWGDTARLSSTRLPDGVLELIVAGQEGHVAQGGPNVKYLMAEILHSLRVNHDFSLKQPTGSIEFTGSIRTMRSDWQKAGQETGQRIQQIVEGVINERGLKVTIKGTPAITDIPPVVNDERARLLALDVIRRAGLEITTEGVPIAPSETFSYWETELKIPGLYIFIGGADPDEYRRIRDTGQTVPAHFLHHTPEFLDRMRHNRAVPYGAVLSVIALELAKQYKIK